MLENEKLKNGSTKWWKNNYKNRRASSKRCVHEIDSKGNMLKKKMPDNEKLCEPDELRF